MRLESTFDTSILTEAGLTIGESKVYLALIDVGLSTVGPILNKSGVTKSIIYRILDRLMEKGLVSFIIKEKTKYFQAASPERILDYIDDKRKDLEEHKHKIEQLLPQLLLKHTQAEKSEATIYVGFKGIMAVHDKRFEKLKSGDEYFFLGLPSSQPEYYHSYWIKDHRKREKLGIKCKLLYKQEVDDNILKNRNSFKLCDARRMPFDIDTPSWILGYKNVIVIGIPLAEKPLAFEIVSSEVATSFKEYFEWFWKKTKKF